ncbi:hypothetical protein BBD46_17315 [Natrialba sp. SSL1]|nr:hypothetical protein BBD46_17315 [Natrialba sp. SSL1]
MEGFRAQVELQTNTRLVICDPVLRIHSRGVFVSLDPDGIRPRFDGIFKRDGRFVRAGRFKVICLFKHGSFFVFNLNQELVTLLSLIVSNFQTVNLGYRLRVVLTETAGTYSTNRTATHHNELSSSHKNV